MATPSIQPMHTLWPLYAPADAPYAFSATHIDMARTWQDRTRAAFAQTLGLGAFAPAPLECSQIAEVDKGDYVRSKFILRTGPHTIMPWYLLIPKGARRPLPGVLALHGHGYGVADIVGLWEDGSERTTASGYHNDFAVALCRYGFAVAAPEISCFGERQNDYRHLDTVNGQPVPSTCAHTAMLALHMGTSVAGMRVHDALRLVDYLETRHELDTQRLGAMGISGGGMHTLFSAAVDPRIKACVISGYFSTFRDSILAMHHCACNFVPGLGQFGEMADIAGLVAPRPLFVEAGTRDPIFPIAAVKQGVQEARRVYGIFGASQRIDTEYFEGRHEIHGTRAYPWLQQQLAT